MITPTSDKKAAATANSAETAKAEKGERAAKPARKKAKSDGAVKVEISDEGRALAQQSGQGAPADASKRKGAAKEPDEDMIKTRDEKEDDLVNFYAKRLVKATKQLDKEEATKLQSQGEAVSEEERAVPEVKESAHEKVKPSKLPTA